MQELNHLILGVVEDCPKVQSAAYQSQGQADRAELAGALSDLPYLLFYVAIGLAAGLRFCLLCAVDSVQFDLFEVLQTRCCCYCVL